MTAMQPITSPRTLDIARIRQDFPIFSQPVRGKRLAVGVCALPFVALHYKRP